MAPGDGNRGLGAPRFGPGMIRRVSIRPAATIVVVREGPGAGFEVLVLRRSRRSRFAPGFVVFPGGVVEPHDEEAAPGAVLDRHDGMDVALKWPTLKTLEALAECRSVDEVLSLRVDQVSRPGAPG